MGFYKGIDGLFFFLLVHFAFIMEILLVHYIEDKENQEENIILSINKNIFYIILFLAFYSHIKISITDPGYIDCYNNLDIIDYYCFAHREINSIKEDFKNNDSLKENNEEYSEEDKYSPPSDEDKIEFESKTSIDSKLKRKIDRKFKIKTNRCSKCYVVRPENSHHCGNCHSCILDQDHHCPFINNCVGLFNKKYFILFNLYALISVIHCSFLFYYYSAFKNNRTFRNSISKNIVGIFWGLFAFIYGLFTFVMLKDQKDEFLKVFKKYKKDKIIHNQLMKLKMRIIFGGNFSIKWLLPFYEGGKIQLYNFIKNKRKEFYENNKKEI